MPPAEIRRLRDLTRLRKAQSNERTRAIQRLEKVLQDAGIKLTSVASQTYSKSARAMLEALLSGVSEPEELAELAKARMRSKIPQLREALANRFEVTHHGIMVAQLLAHIDTLDSGDRDAGREDRGDARPTRQARRAAANDPRGRGPNGAGADRRVRPGHDPVPDGRALRVVGRDLPGPSRVSWAQEVRTHAPRTEVVDRGADGGREGRRPHARARTSPLITRSCVDGAGSPRRSARPVTTSSLRTSTSSATKSRFASSDLTGSASATRRSTAHGVCNANSKRSATRSPSRKANQPQQAA